MVAVGYSPKHLCQLSFKQCYDDGEANTGRDQVQQGGLWTDRTLWTHQTSVKLPCTRVFLELHLCVFEGVHDEDGEAQSENIGQETGVEVGSAVLL